MASIRHDRPYFIGVVGGTGSGKTTIAERVAEALPAGSVAIIAHDSYYIPRPNLAPEERDQLNFDHPDALDNALLVRQLDELRAERAVEVPVYDFSTHLRLDKTRRVEAAPIVIVEGILVLADERLRQRLDLKLYVDTAADIRILRRIRRDIDERGRSFEQVREQYYETVRPMHEQFVEPSKRWADVIIPEGGHNDVALDLVIGRLEKLLDRDGG